VLLQEPRQRAIIDERAASGFQSSGAFQSFLSHKHAAPSRAGGRAPSIANPGWRVQHEKEIHEGGNEQFLREALAIESGAIAIPTPILLTGILSAILISSIIPAANSPLGSAADLRRVGDHSIQVCFQSLYGCESSYAKAEVLFRTVENLPAACTIDCHIGLHPQMANNVAVTLYCYNGAPPATLAYANLTIKSHDSGSAWFPINHVPRFRNVMKRRSI